MKKNDWLLVIATALYSWLFYKEAAGINFLIFSAVLTAFLLLRDPSLPAKRKWLLAAAGTLISGAAVAIYGNWLSVWANVISLSLLSGVSVSTRSSVIITLFHSLYSYGSSMVFMILDTVQRRSKTDPASRSSSFFVKLLLVLIPLLVTLLFFFLYRGSNAIFNNFAKNINFDFITWQWIFFTLLGFILLYGFFYHRRIKEIASWDENAPCELAYREVNEEEQGGFFGVRNEYISGILLFVMLNILLLVVNLLDVQYVYISKVLPEGLSHSEYVHQGIELLIISIIIAIAIILFVFRGKMNFYSKSKALRLLATLWIIQNMFMIVSTIVRNNMYVAEYGGLTYKRIGVYVYLALALIGLVTTWVKIWKLKSNWYLFRANSISWYCMLVVASLINWDALITGFNTGHAKDLKELDKGYLIDLAPSTLPEMLAYNDTSSLLRETMAKGDYSTDIFRGFDQNYLDRTLENRLHGKLYRFLNKRSKTGWQSWNYDDARIYREVLALSENGKITRLSLGTFGIETIQPLHVLDKVTALDLNNNRMSKSLSELTIFPELRKLDLGYNSIDSLEQLPLLPKLEELTLNGNSPHSFVPLKNVPSLTSLNLLQCRYVDLRELPAFEKLTHLELSENSIYNLSELRKLRSLQSLSLRNTTAGTASETLPCIPSLKVLDLSNNAVAGKNNFLMEGAVRCFNLEELDLSGNQLRDLYGVTRTIGSAADSSSVGLTKLRKLRIDRNEIITLTGIERFTLLEELSMSGNQVTNFYPVSQLANLRTLYAGSCTFNDLSSINNLTRLEALDISNCNTAIPANIKELVNLKWLNLSGTSFRDVNLLAGMKQLKELYLQNTQVSGVNALSGLTQLETLYLGSNIRDLTPLYKLKQLKTLYVNSASAQQVEALKKALPNTTVNFTEENYETRTY